MKKNHYSTSAALIHVILVFVFVFGMFGGGRTVEVDATSIAPTVPPSIGGLEIAQGSSTHFSIISGEELFFHLDVRNPVDGAQYSWKILNPPAHGEAFLEQAGEGVMVNYHPAPGYTGTDLVAVAVQDQVGNLARIGVLIDVIPAREIPATEVGIDAINFGLPVVNPENRYPEMAPEDPSRQLLPAVRQEFTTTIQPAALQLEENEFFTIDEVEISDDRAIYRNTITGSPVPPVDVSANTVDLSDPQITADMVLLSDVPKFTWVFGCSAVSGAMIAGYYDRTDFPNVYTGTSNGGVIPLFDFWSTWTDGVGDTYPNNPLVASRNGLDGRTIRGSIDDYWVEYGSTADDPYITNDWTQHAWGDAIGDYMKTSQSVYDNTDGSTSFYWNGTDPTPLTCDETETYGYDEDGTLGIRQFYEARGYQTTACYLQSTDNQATGGFSLNQYRAEIDAGYPVMIHVTGHTMVGVGYEAGSSTIYIHDTWNNVVQSMEWGGSYSDMSMWGVSIVHPGTPTAPENDLITSPTLITSFPADFSQDTTLATRSADDPDLTGCGLAAGEASVWYKYAPVADGVLALDTFGSNYDTIMGVWSGEPGNLTEEACNDDYSGTQSYIGIPVEGDVDYYVGISQYSGGISSLSDGAKIEKTNLADEVKADDISVDAGGTLVFHASNTVTTYPVIEVVPFEDRVWVLNVMPSSSVTLTVGGFSTSLISDSGGSVHFDLSGSHDIVPGEVVTVNDGYGTASHTVTNLVITNVDEVADQIKGTADPLVELEVYGCDDYDCEWLYPTAGTDGNWLADFSTIPFDITAGVSGWAIEFDADWNRTVVYWYIPDPYMRVYPLGDYINGNDWSPNTAVTLTVDMVNEFHGTTDSDGDVFIDTYPFDILPGQTLVMSDGTYTRTHVVRNVALTAIDEALEKVSGTADAYSELSAYASDDINYEWKYPVADETGHWEVIFDDVDIAPGTYGWIYQYDEEGNSTRIHWNVADPVFQVYPQFNNIHVYDWTPFTNLTIYIDGTEITTAQTDDDGYVYIPLAFDLEPGQEVVVTDGVLTRTHAVTNVLVSTVNQFEDIVGGTAEAGSEVFVQGHGTEGWDYQAVTTDVSGNWTAAFPILDIVPGVYGWAIQYDEQGNHTCIHWDVPNPYMIVYPQSDSVSGYDWTPNTTVKLLIDGVVIATETSDEDGYVYFNVAPYNIVSGQVVKMKDGVYVRTHTVTVVKVKEVNPDADTVKGKAAPGSAVSVIAWEPNGYYGDILSATTNADGVWLINFSGIVDIGPGSSGSAYQYDSQGNSTRVSWYLPNPRIYVNHDSDWIYGWEWAPGVKVTLTVGTFSKSTTTSDDGYFNLSLAGIYDLQSGQTVVVSDGTTTKTHEIRNLAVTEIDEIDDEISGTANPDGDVLVVAFDQVSYGTGMWMMPDSLGNWLADFSGYEDMAPGTWGFVEQIDDDGDGTEIYYDIPYAPVLNSLGRNFAVAGQPDMTLYVNGENFAPTSVVWWGGEEKDTTYINSTQLTIDLTEADLAVPGIVDVHVITPAPGGGTSSSLSFQIVGITPQYGGKLDSNYVTFDWDDITAATLYKIQFSTVPDFSTLLVSTKTSTSSYNGYTSALPRGKTYYWRIRPYYGDINGPWSVTLQFNSQDPLPAPVLGATEIVGYRVTMNWLPVDGAVKYKLQVAKDSTFTLLILNETVLKSATSRELTLPEKTKTYYWRVKAVDADGFKSGWSNIGSFTVPVY